MRRELTRRRFTTAMGATLGCGAVLYPQLGLAAELPAALQAKLLGKVAAYDRNMKRRAAGTVRVLMVSRPDKPESVAAAAQVRREIAELSDIGGLPYKLYDAPFSSATALLSECERLSADIVYLSTGLEGEIQAIASALSRTSIISATGTIDYVKKGVVLGLGMVSGSPQIYINLPQAKAQDVQFEGRLLTVAKVLR